tara:strand:- start:52 stop:363 length:312 start_codon:yes stop_codon:yes gene_type:complete
MPQVTMSRTEKGYLVGDFTQRPVLSQPTQRPNALKNPGEELERLYNLTNNLLDNGRNEEAAGEYIEFMNVLEDIRLTHPKIYWEYAEKVAPTQEIRPQVDVQA